MRVRVLCCFLMWNLSVLSGQTFKEGCWKTLRSNIDSSKSNFVINEMSFANSSTYFLLGYDKTNANATITPRLSMYNADGNYNNIETTSNVYNFDTYNNEIDRGYAYNSVDNFTISGRGDVRTIQYFDYSYNISIPSFGYFYQNTSTTKFVPHIEGDIFNGARYVAYKKGDSVQVASTGTGIYPFFAKVNYTNFDFLVSDGSSTTFPSYHLFTNTPDNSIEMFSLVRETTIYNQKTVLINIPNQNFKVVKYIKNQAYILAYRNNTLTLYNVDLSTGAFSPIGNPFTGVVSPNYDFKMLNSGELSIAFIASSEVKTYQYDLTSGQMYYLEGIKANVTSTSHVALSVEESGKLSIAYEIGKVIAFRYHAPKLSKPVIDRIFAIDTAKKQNFVMVNKGNAYTYCGPFTYEQKSLVKLPGFPRSDIDTVFFDAYNYVTKENDPRAFISGEFELYTGSFIKDFVLKYSNACYVSDTLNFHTYSQNFDLTTTASVTSPDCQTSGNKVVINSQVNWLPTNFNLQAPTVDTMFAITATTPATVTKFPNTSSIPVSEIPIPENLSGATYAIHKVVSTALGCKATASVNLVLYKSPDPSSISLTKVSTNKRLLPYQQSTVPYSDTILYFAWAARAFSVPIRPSFDLLARYQVNAGLVNLVSGTPFSFAVDTPGVTAPKYVDLRLNNYASATSSTCSTNTVYRFMLKKVTFAELGLTIKGDTLLKPADLYSFAVLGTDVANKLGNVADYRFVWKAYKVNTGTSGSTLVGKQYVEFISDTTSTNFNKMVGKTLGDYILEVEIIWANNKRSLGKVTHKVAVRSPRIVLTSDGTTIDANRLASTSCKADTFLCTPVYAKTITYSNLRQFRNTCQVSPTVDNTTDTSKYIKVFPGEDYVFELNVGSNFASDSAGIAVAVDFDNDSEIGELGEVLFAATEKNSSFRLNVSIPNKPEYVGEKRLSVYLSANKILTESDVQSCENPNNQDLVREDFLIFIEKPLALQASSFVTPNGDHKNDSFTIRGIDARFGTELRVYNKMGRQIFERQNYGLNGENESSDRFENELKPDTYYYVFTNGNNTIKGFFELR